MADIAFYRSLVAVLEGRAAPIGDDVKQGIADLALGRAIREAAALVPVPVIHVSWHTDRGGCDGQYLTHPIDMAANEVVEAARELIELYDEETN